jgi:hypothetical protein
MSTSTPPGAFRLERFRHRQYETARSDDLSAQDAVQVALQAWHNRAFHRAYGVVFGLDADLVPEPEARAPDWKVRVKPGLAYDATGQPLALTRSADVPIPLDTAGLTLVLRAGNPAPVLAWVPTNGFRITDGVGVAKSRGEKVWIIRLTVPTVPAELVGKVDYDGTDHLTTHGLLSAEQYQALRKIVETGSLGELNAAFSSWPLEAPKRSVNSGLEVRVQPGSQDPQNPQSTLWELAVTGGSVINDAGQSLVLSSSAIVPLNGAVDHYLLALQPISAGAELKLLVAPPIASAHAVVLATVQAPDGAPVQLVDGLPTPADVPAINDILTALRDKVRYDSGAKTLKVIGFLTQDDRDKLVDIVAAMDIGKVPDVHAHLKVSPQVTSTDFPKERPPFFPIRSRPLARPRTASGESVPRHTEWKIGDNDLFGTKVLGQTGRVYEATIDLAAAGFTEVPQVFAWIQYHPPADDTPGPVPPPPPAPVLRGEIDESRLSVKQFVFRVWLLDLFSTAGWPPVPPNKIVDFLHDQVSVCWLAVQAEPMPLQRFVTGRRCPSAAAGTERNRP